MVLADPPTYDATWEWNRNVTVQTIWSTWTEGTNNSSLGETYLKFSNGQVCYIALADAHLLSLAMMVRAQNLPGEFVCVKDSSRVMDGLPARRLHRIKF